MLFVLCLLALAFVLVPLLRSRGRTDPSVDVDRQALLRELHSQRQAEVTEVADAELRQALSDEMDSVLLAEHTGDGSVTEAATSSASL